MNESRAYGAAPAHPGGDQGSVGLGMNRVAQSYTATVTEVSVRVTGR